MLIDRGNQARISFAAERTRDRVILLGSSRLGRVKADIHISNPTKTAAELTVVRYSLGDPINREQACCYEVCGIRVFKLDVCYVEAICGRYHKSRPTYYLWSPCPYNLSVLACCSDRDFISGAGLCPKNLNFAKIYIVKEAF